MSSLLLWGDAFSVRLSPDLSWCIPLSAQIRVEQNYGRWEFSFITSKYGLGIRIVKRVSYVITIVWT